MIGTEKQIAWGEKIKEKNLKKVNEKLAFITGLLERKKIRLEDAPDKIKNEYKIYTKIKEKIENEEKASWFIEHQEVALLYLEMKNSL